MKRVIVSSLIVLAVLVLAAKIGFSSFQKSHAAQGATYYVATTGNDSNSGTIDHPFASVAHASSVAQPGDTVDVRGGVYALSDGILIASYGTATAPITYQSYPGEKAIFDGTKAPASKTCLVLMGQYDIVQNLECSGPWFQGILIWNARHLQVLNNTIHDTTAYGLLVAADKMGNTTDIQVSGNTIYHNGGAQNGTGGLDTTYATYVTLAHNTIYENRGLGFDINGCDHITMTGNILHDNSGAEIFMNNATGSIIEKNLLYEALSTSANTKGIQMMNGTDIASNPLSNNTVRNNIVLNTNTGFFYSATGNGGGIKNTLIANNTFYGATGFIVYIEGTNHSNTTIANNIFYQTNKNWAGDIPQGSGLTFQHNTWWGGSATGGASSSDVNADPLFVNASGANPAGYQLQATSPLRQAGVPLSTVLDDFTGAARPSQGNYDIGAYQYGSGTTPTPTPTPTPLPNTPPGPVNKTWNFAEGRVGAGFREYLTIENPSATACAASILYLYTLDGSKTPLTKTLMVAVPAATRVTESVNADLGITDTTTPAATLSSVVTVDASTPSCPGFVAERPLYMTNYHGLSSGTDVLGSSTLGKTFSFADVPSGSGYSSYLTILNPNAVAATVTANYYAGGAVVGTQTLLVPANARGTIIPGTAIPALPTHSAAVLTSDQPVMVERPSYLTDVNGLSGAADVVGTQTLSNDWLFAEGYATSTSQETLTLANVDPTATANVTITLKSIDGHTQQFPLSVPAQSQLIWNVNANNTFSGASPEVSAEVTSTGANIVVQREMFYQYHHTLSNGTLQTASFTDVVGMPAAAIKSTYSFAEGYTHTNYHEWLTLQNPTGAVETIYITLVNGNGQKFVQSYQVRAQSRFTADITAIMQNSQVISSDIAGNEISLTVQTLNNGGLFVAERPMYFNTSGTAYAISGGTDAVGFGG